MMLGEEGKARQRDFLYFILSIILRIFFKNIGKDNVTWEAERNPDFAFQNVLTLIS